MAMTKNLRVDDLGHETQFVIVRDLISDSTLAAFNDRLYAMALGFTRIDATGGWRGAEERVYLYRVASLSNDQRADLIRFLLDNSGMSDLYVVLPGGLAQGYCYESAPAPVKLELHGWRNTGWPIA